MKVVTDW